MLLREVEYARRRSRRPCRCSARTKGRALQRRTLVNVMKARAAPDVLVDLADLTELRAIGFSTDGLLEIGAMVTYAQLVGSSEVEVARPILAEVAATIGDVQVRNRGTVGGNVCVADPTNHLPPLHARPRRDVHDPRGVGRAHGLCGRVLRRRVHDRRGGGRGFSAKVSVPPSSGAGDGFAGLTIGKHGTYVANAAATVSDEGVRIAAPAASTRCRSVRARWRRRLAAGDVSKTRCGPPRTASARRSTRPPTLGSGEFRRHLAEVSATRAVLQAASRRKGA